MNNFGLPSILIAVVLLAVAVMAEAQQPILSREAWLKVLPVPAATLPASLSC
jgi:hypothetical protein